MSELSWQWIDSDEGLARLCDQASRAEAVALDTEFVRTRTLYAQLGLIQLYDGTNLALVDPLAIDDLGPFWRLLENESVVKVLHSCSEDLEIFAQQGGVQPKPLFDTQVAGVLLNKGAPMGYGKMVEAYLGLELDKGESRTNWLARPLRDSQLQYAAADVLYLLQIYHTMKQEIADVGRYHWLMEEGERLTEGRLAPPDPQAAYLKVKNAYQLRPEQLAILKSLAAWRLGVAQKRDLALNFVIKDAAMLTLAKRAPRSINYLTQLDCLTERDVQRHGKAILRAVAEADLDNPPEPVDPLSADPAFRDAAKLVRKALTQVCEQQQVATELMASKKLVHQYLKWRLGGEQGEQPVVLRGWRGELARGSLEELSL
ncbi:ribonuclease D [Ferrimonas sediminicola]|uniref:Ribonuclease D n=1 Tax=Ferrimonas sediminicola TaxID=2569538 RepID=A0A4U1BBY6_9GAMM|nr:ribonuclease D [Ferrimonas sediminicola]TKB48508.1 ribonuclease D [Ferrimonas sediminicola]